MRRQNRATSPCKLAFSLGTAAMFTIVMLAAEVSAQAGEEELPQLSAVVEPLRPGVTESQVFAELAAHNERRRAALHDYSVLRTYQVLDLKGKVHAEEVGRMQFLAPDKKAFTVDSEAGSALVRHMALNSLIKSEIETAAGKEHHDSTISADNYSLNLLGEQQVVRIDVSSQRLGLSEKTSIYLRASFGLMLKITRWYGSKAILRNSCPSGSNALTSYGSTRKFRDSGFRRRIRHWFRCVSMGRRF
jgi:hypothetical protein